MIAAIIFLMFCHDGQVVDGILESVKGIIEYALVITNWLVRLHHLLRFSQYWHSRSLVLVYREWGGSAMGSCHGLMSVPGEHGV